MPLMRSARNHALDVRLPREWFERELCKDVDGRDGTPPERDPWNWHFPPRRREGGRSDLALRQPHRPDLLRRRAPDHARTPAGVPVDVLDISRAIGAVGSVRR